MTLSAGGVVAFYPTKVPHHDRSKFLGDRDSFGDFADARSSTWRELRGSVHTRRTRICTAGRVHGLLLRALPHQLRPRDSSHARPRDRNWRDYTVWYQESLFSLMKLWDDEIHKIKPESTFLPNSRGGVGNSIDWKRFGEMAETLVSDHQGRSGMMAPWSNGMAAKVFRSAAGSKRASEFSASMWRGRTGG